MSASATRDPVEHAAPASIQACDLADSECDGSSRSTRIARCVPAGAIAIAGERIAAVGPEADILHGFQARRVLDAAGARVHPGFIDAHFHVSQHSRAGLDGRPGAPGGGRRRTSPTGRPRLGRGRVRQHVALACLDLLRNGYTGFVDGGTSFDPDAVAAAAEATAFGVGLQTRTSGTVAS